MRPLWLKCVWGALNTPAAYVEHIMVCDSPDKYPWCFSKDKKDSQGATWEMVLLDMCTQRRLKKSANLHSLIRFCIIGVKKTLNPWLSKMCPIKILIRLRRCASWYKSLLSAHVQGRFLAHLSYSDMVSFCDHILSVVCAFVHLSVHASVHAFVNDFLKQHLLDHCLDFNQSQDWSLVGPLS